jgi:hypothetical protein
MAVTNQDIELIPYQNYFYKSESDWVSDLFTVI